MKMRTVLIVMAATCLTTAAAHAQSFDGDYRGTLLFVRETIVDATGDTCGNERISFTVPVRNAMITTRHSRAGLSFTAPVASDGSFLVTGQYYGRGSTNRPVFLEWKGAIRGAQMEGTFVGYGPGRTCYFSFTAKRMRR